VKIHKRTVTLNNALDYQPNGLAD